MLKNDHRMTRRTTKLKIKKINKSTPKRFRNVIVGGQQSNIAHTQNKEKKKKREKKKQNEPEIGEHNPTHSLG